MKINGNEVEMVQSFISYGTAALMSQRWRKTALAGPVVNRLTKSIFIVYLASISK